jgi:hypothetical protein
MIWEGFERKRSWADFKILFRHCRGRTEENHERTTSDRRLYFPFEGSRATDFYRP